ncbi:MAG TPA: hypothetical protein VFC92_08445 [Bacteroidales bacterium]|nr:hypothetical protein [Bacteroidales bacterium]
MTENKNRTFKERFFAILPLPSLIGLIAGAVGGWIYYTEMGCTSGTCAITSNPYMSIIWGALMGYLIGGFFIKKKTVSKPASKDS